MIDFLLSTSFKHPWLLLSLVIIPFLIHKKIRGTGNDEPALRMSRTESLLINRSFKATWISRLLLPLRIITITSLIFAVARPQFVIKEEQVKADAVDIVLAIDLSSSMLARDFKPDRLEVSKEVGIDFVNKRPHDRIGLVVFAGEAYTQCPLTTDHTVLKDFLSNLQCGILNDGTAIGMGLATAVNRLKESNTKSKIIILLTDGVNNSGYVQPSTATQLAKELEIKIYTIGVGSTREALAPVSRRSNGEYIFGLTPVEIDETLLDQVAQQTGGRYFRATNRQSLQNIYDEIDKLEKTEIEVNTFKRYAEAFYPLALLALLSLLAEILLSFSILL
jgi:Ca-activated chloride channel family protein